MTDIMEYVFTVLLLRWKCLLVDDFFHNCFLIAVHYRSHNVVLWGFIIPTILSKSQLTANYVGMEFTLYSFVTAEWFFLH